MGKQHSYFLPQSQQVTPVPTVASLTDIFQILLLLFSHYLCLTLCDPMDYSKPGLLSSLSPRVCPNSCPLSQWRHPSISSFVTSFSSCPQSFPASFSYKSALGIRGPNCWSFSFSICPSNEYSGLISFRIDWFDILAVQGRWSYFLDAHSDVWHSFRVMLYPKGCYFSPRSDDCSSSKWHWVPS